MPDHDFTPALEAASRLKPVTEREKALVLAEREACARIASAEMGDPDCDHRHMMDPETGEVPCQAEINGDVCTCAEIATAAGRIADRIRKRG